MKKIKTAIILFHLLSLSCFCQVVILPGDKSIDKTFLKPDTYSMSYAIKQNGTYIDIGEYAVSITTNDQKFEVKTSLSFNNNAPKWTGHFIADSQNLKPISSSDITSDKSTLLNFSNTIKGSVKDNKTGKKSSIEEKSTGDYFDISIYPFIIKSLPLTTGYKAIIPVFDYDATEKNKFCNVVIKEVKSDLHISDLTGEHKVWKVSTYEEGTKHNFDFFIDKTTRRIWQINIVSNKGDKIMLVNKQTDFNPFKNKFDKEETLKLVHNGNATIQGEAFVRDNENEGMLKGMAVLNINKKQFAPKGTTIVLIPNTAYYKEWMELNKKQEKIKNAKMIPLPKDAFDCFKFTTVYDDEGHFEFTNLMKGDYLLSTSFGYKHTSRRSEVVGASDVYYGGNYVGSNVYTSVFSYKVGANANIQKEITVKTDGETLKVKLKKTR